MTATTTVATTTTAAAATSIPPQISTAEPPQRPQPQQLNSLRVVNLGEPTVNEIIDYDDASAFALFQSSSPAGKPTSTYYCLKSKYVLCTHEINRVLCFYRRKDLYGEEPNKQWKLIL